MRKLRKSPEGALAADKRFGRYRPEEERKRHKAGIVSDKKVEELLAAFKDFGQVASSLSEITGIYEAAECVASAHKYAPEDVEKLSLALSGILPDDHGAFQAGIFLSALINRGEGSDYRVISNPDIPLAWFGYSNRKAIEVEGSVGYYLARDMRAGRIAVHGDAGHSLGEGMKDGEIIVTGNADDLFGKCLEGGTVILKGNAGSSVGHAMKGRKIIVEGNAGSELGNSMSGGRITVEGNAGGSYIGFGMTGGEIRINGEMGELGWYMVAGKIIHKGKLIVDK
jgi:hypothetical protein